METEPRIFALIFALIGLPIVYFICFSRTGKGIGWDLLKYNPPQKLLFDSEQEYHKSLHLVGVIISLVLMFSIIFLTGKLLSLF